MALRLRPLEINYRVLTFLLILTLPVLVIGGLVVLGGARVQLRDSYGRYLGQVAERTAAAVDAFVFRRVLDVVALGKVPAIREVAATASQEQPDPDLVRKLDQQWQVESGPPPGLINQMSNPAARFLREVVRDDPMYREILLTDRHGRLVAASGISSDYYQADEDWWLGAAKTSNVNVEDVAWDESARVFALDISVPVLDLAGDSVVGIMKVVADSRELFAAISGVQRPGTAEAILLRSDGSVVFSQGTADPSVEFYAADLLREQVGALERGDPQSQTFYRARSGDGTTQLVAIAQSQLGRSYANLPWIVAVSAPEAELFAPVRAQAWNLLLLLALTVAGVLGLLFWLSSHGPAQ